MHVLYVCMYVYIYPSCFPRVSWTICYSSLKTCLPTNTEKDSERIELRLHVYIPPPPPPPLLHTCFLFNETSVNHYTDFTIQHVCPTCSNLIMTPRKQENPDILDNRHGQEVKASLMWRALNANTLHTLSGSDSQTRPVSEKQRGGSQYLLHLKGPGQELSWKWLFEFQKRLSRWTGRPGSLREVEESRQTARRSDKNSDGLSGRAAFHYRVILGRY